MINGLLGFWTPGPIELLIILIIFGLIFALPVFLIMYLIKANKEKQKLRLELGKLADEAQQLRKQQPDSSNSP